MVFSVWVLSKIYKKHNPSEIEPAPLPPIYVPGKYTSTVMLLSHGNNNSETRKSNQTSLSRRHHLPDVVRHEVRKELQSQMQYRSPIFLGISQPQNS